MKDVAIEQMQRVMWQLVRDPGESPGVEALVVVVSRELMETGRERPRVNGRQQQENDQGRRHGPPKDALHRDQ